MNIEDRLARLERENRRLKLAGLLVLAVIGLAFVVMLPPPPTAAAGHIVAAHGFHLVDNDGNLVGEWILNDRGDPNLRMWLGDSYVSLGVNAPVSGEHTLKTYFGMNGGDGLVQISTPGPSSVGPSVIIYRQRSPGGAFWPIWSAPPGSAPGT
jgi:hypothetical protein